MTRKGSEADAGSWRVLIVEDDPLIASIYTRTVAGIDGLDVAGTVVRGEDALEFLRRRHCDLMLLDLKLAGMNGVRLLHRLRGEGNAIEVIALTATRTSASVRAVIQRGAIDYLVKPFTIERLRQSLGFFVSRANALRDDQLDQDAVDRACAGGRVPERWMPKGLTLDGLTRVRGVLERDSRPVCAADVAEGAGLARVTARRYLEYLVSIEHASVEAAPAGPGRPRKLYQVSPSAGLYPSSTVASNYARDA
jgi:two-component system response regulator DctR